MNTVIAEAQLDFYDGGQVAPALVRVLAPEPDGNDWRCRYQLEWPGYSTQLGIMGVSSMQALTLALKHVPVAIGTSDDFKAGRIGQYGNRFTTFAQLNDAIGLAPMKGFEQ